MNVKAIPAVKFWMLALVASSLVLTSCNKDKDDEPDNKDLQAPNQIPQFSDADAVLVAIETAATQSTPIGPISIEIGTAVALFLENNNPEKFVDAGTVKAEGETLSKMGNNSYVFRPSSTNPMGITYSPPGIEWSISGSSEFPATTITSNRYLPSMGAITSTTTLTQGEEYTLEVENVVAADSVIFSLIGQAGNVMVTRTGNVKAHTFSANEVNSLGKGDLLLQVAAYNIDKQSSSGKTIYLIGQYVENKSGECK